MPRLMNLQKNRIYWMGAGSSPDRILCLGQGMYMKYPFAKVDYCDAIVLTSLVEKGTWTRLDQNLARKKRHEDGHPFTSWFDADEEETQLLIKLVNNEDTPEVFAIELSRWTIYIVRQGGWGGGWDDLEKLYPNLNILGPDRDDTIKVCLDWQELNALSLPPEFAIKEKVQTTKD